MLFGIAISLVSPLTVAAAAGIEVDVANVPLDHCAANTDTGIVVCVAQEQDLAEAVLNASGETLVYGADDSHARATGKTLAYAMGTIYSYPDYGDRSYTVTGSQTCTAGGAASITNLATIGWNDDIDSFKSYNVCQTKIWENTGFTGTSYGYATNVADLGSMRNKGSSIRWG